MTADDLLRLNVRDKRTELIKGTLIVREPAGFRHGQIAAELSALLRNHVQAGDLGFVLAAETGFKLASEPDTVRAADVAFVRKDRLPEPPVTGYAALAPDLVVEVLSPDDRPGEVLAKVADWLDAGTRLIWVIDPKRRHVLTYRANGDETITDERGSLDGEDVLPGFACPVRSLF